MTAIPTQPLIRRSLCTALAFSPVLAAMACGGDGSTVETTETGSSTSGTGSNTGTGGSGGSGATGTGGSVATGTGGSLATGTGGAGGATSGCTPNEVVGCYDGPANTEGIGLCAGGMKTCNADGTAFGDCEGQVLPGTEICGNTADEDCDGADQCAGNYLWANGYGDINVQHATAVALDASDNIFVTGNFRGMLDFGKDNGNLPLNGSSMNADDVFVAKLDANGKALWSKGFGDDKPQVANGIATDPMGNTIVTGAFAGGINFGKGVMNSAGATDIFLAKFDSIGNLIWQFRFGGATGADAGRAVTTDAMGNIFLTGSFTGTSTVKVEFSGNATPSPASAVPGGGLEDLFVAKFDKNCNLLWVRAYGNASAQVGNAIAVDAKGNVGVTGSFAGSMVVPAPVGTLTTAGLNDIFVVLFDSLGLPLWGKKYGDGVNQDGRGIAFAPSGDFYVVADGAGTTDFSTLKNQPLKSDGATDVMVAKFSGLDAIPPTTYQWSSRFGNPFAQSATGVSVDDDGNAVIVGKAEGKMNFGGGELVSKGTTDGYAAKFDSLGTHVWSKFFGDGLAQTVNAVAATTSGTVLVGAFQGVINFGGADLSTPDPTKTVEDLFVAKLSP